MTINLQKSWKIVFIMLPSYFIYMLICWLLEEPAEAHVVNGQYYIAHAGGVINQYRYTNS